MAQIGQPLLRKEDDRFLTGRGTYVDDLAIPDQAYAAFVRSPHAHATIGRIDAAPALAVPGVRAVLTGEDWAKAGGGTTPVLWEVTSHDGSPMHEISRPILTTGTARHVGDTVALVVADSPAAAADGAEAVAVDWEPLPAIVDTAGALAPDAPLVHPDFGTNVSYDWRIGDAAAAEAALQSAAHVTELTLVNNRLAPNPIEPRAVIGAYDASKGQYTVWSTTQNPHLVRSWLSRDTLRADEQNIRVVSPDVGGGFGQKTYHYPEEAALPWAAKVVGRPVRWTASRSENLAVDTHARDHVTTCRMGFDGEGRIVGLQVDTIANLGAYQSQFGAAIPSVFYGGMFSGLYAVPAISCRVRGVYTNTVAVDAYRGAGAPECAYVVERLVETGARELGIDRLTIRERNLVPRARMPYTSATGITYDVGDFPATFAKARALADVDALRAEQARLRDQGVLMGIGAAAFIRGGGAGPSRLAAQIGSRMGLWDVASVRVHPSGKVTVFCGSHSHGQAHATTYSQIVADRLGCAVEDVEVVEGDTDRIPYGLGTWASRSITVVGSALSIAAERIIDKGKQLAAHVLECAEADLDFADATYRVRGTDRALSFVKVADLAYSGADYPDGFELGLEETAFFDPGDFNYPYAVHVCTVNVDPETGQVHLTGYYGVSDVGRVINPLVVDGQRHGATVQGIGQALLENVVYDADGGQLVSGSFMDYGLPRADDLPPLMQASHETLTETNPLGVKGVGELDTAGPPAAIVNAVVDALSPFGIRHIDMPLSPERVWRAIREAEAR